MTTRPVVVPVDPVVATAQPVPPEADRELLLDRRRARRVALLVLPEALDRLVRGGAARLLVLAGQEADRLPVAVERGVELRQRHLAAGHLAPVVRLHRRVERAAVDHLVRDRGRDADDVGVSVAAPGTRGSRCTWP